jgi:asparagine synthase (glutamine-hydrolysing)
MCGIAGSLSWGAPPAADAVALMTRRLASRGPDAEGLITRGPIALGHRRLAVIDPTPEGLQPMADATGRIWIVFNGEIYNYRDLRARLMSEGASFLTATDTEVILEAYKRWGEDCLQRLNGMFAFALWDEPRQRLLLARDRLGEKPLYYWPHPETGVVFASGLKALRLYPGVDRGINAAALGQFLSLNYVLTNESMLSGVHKLPAAHFLVVERGRPLVATRYWDLARHFREKRSFRNEGEAAEELDALLLDSVRLRLVSDVPLGAFLSGGIDSSIIAAGMRRLCASGRIRTFTMGFGEASYDEMPGARATATHLGTEHTERLADQDIARSVPAVVRAVDEPFADTSIVPTYHLSGFARQHVTVCLSGDGSDEIFAGYATYAADRLRHLTSWLPGPMTRGLLQLFDRLLPVSFDKVSFDYRLRQFLRGHGLPADRAHVSWRLINDDGAKRRLLHPDWDRPALVADPFDSFRAHFDEVADCHYLDQAMYVDAKTWLVDDILVKVDQASMAHGLEVRPPFLDHRLVEFAAALPVEWKFQHWRQKHLLKASQRRHLPAAILDRRKQGFNAPVSHWLNGTLEEIGRSATRSPAMEAWFDLRAIDALWAAHRARKRDHGLPLFGLTCLGLWMDPAIA